MSPITKLKNLIGTKHIFLKLVLPLIALLLLLNAVFSLLKNPKREPTEPQNPVALAAFAHNISGLGVSEPQSEIIAIGVNVSGVVSQVYVTAGQQVKAHGKLFTIDDREAKANFELKKAQAKAAQFDAEDKNLEFAMYKKIKDSRAYSRDEFNKKRIAAEIYQQKAKQAKAEMEAARVALEKLTIRSPINGEVLKVDIRPGEFAAAGVLSDPLMMVGDLSKMHVRVEIDESEAHRLNPQKPAVAFLRGKPDFKIPLQFVRIEPYVVPKVSLSGGNAEKIDTRVLQVIYSFENNQEPKILVGQQLDVFVESE